MNTSGDAAESIVRMSLQGLEVAVRLSGSGAKNIAALMIAILKDQKQTKGKTRLTNMLKSGKELKVFIVKEEDLRKFTEEAISPIQEENVIENIVIAADENQKQQYEKSENTQQNSQEEINTTIIEETNENEVNYPAIGLMGISTVFLMLTIIFSIIFAKYQLKLKKNLSK